MVSEERFSTTPISVQITSLESSYSETHIQTLVNLIHTNRGTWESHS
jgi:hypothetical protein